MVLAVCRGVLASVGVSKNARRYTAEAIRRMTARAQAPIAAGRLPLRVAHDGPDGPDGIVGRISALELAEDGSAIATAEILPTRAGKDAAILLSGPQPVLAWSLEAMPVGPVGRESGPNGVLDVFEDIELTAVAMTGWPGIDAARPRMERQRRPGTIVESAPDRPHPLGVNLAALSGPELRRYLGAAHLAPQPATDVGQLGPDATPGQLLAQQLYRERDELIARQRAEWLARDTR